MDRVTQAFLLALLAGLATGIGSCIAFSIYGLMSGMAVMAASLALFQK